MNGALVQCRIFSEICVFWIEISRFQLAFQWDLYFYNETFFKNFSIWSHEQIILNIKPVLISTNIWNASFFVAFMTREDMQDARTFFGLICVHTRIRKGNALLKCHCTQYTMTLIHTSCATHKKEIWSSFKEKNLVLGIVKLFFDLFWHLH